MNKFEISASVLNFAQEVIDGIKAKEFKTFNDLLEGKNKLFAALKVETLPEEITVILLSAQKMGMKISVISPRIYSIAQGKKRRLFSSRSSIPFSTRWVTNQKDVTKHLLRLRQVATPQGEVFESVQAASKYFEKQERPQVVKPLDLSLGVGITTNIGNPADFHSAAVHALKLSKKIIVEDFITGFDVRIVVINGEAVSAFVREPAHVVGDGSASLNKLVKAKNVVRGTQVYKPPIEVSALTKKFLKKKYGMTMSSVPKKGEKVYFASVANVSQGGESIVIFDELHSSYKQVAARALAAFPSLVYGAVDFIIEDFTKPATSTNYSVLEINANPSISGSMFPSYGRPINVVEKLLGYYFTDDARTSSLESGSPPRLKLAAPLSKSTSKSFKKNSTNLLRRAAFQRNLEVEFISDQITHVTMDSEFVGFYSSVSSFTTTPARRVATNRTLTKRLLRSMGIAGPVSTRYRPSSKQKAWNDLQQDLSGAHYLKSLDTSIASHYLPVDVTQSQFDDYWQDLEKKGSKLIFVEKAVEGKNYQLVYINGNFSAALEFYNQEVDGSKQPKCRDVSEIISPAAIRKFSTFAGYLLADYYHIAFNVIASDLTDSSAPLAFRVISLKSNPNLVNVHYPDEGSGRDLAAAIIESVFPEVRRRKFITRKLQIEFSTSTLLDSARKRQLSNLFQLHGMVGWGESLAECTYRIYFAGAPNAVNHLLAELQKVNADLGLTKITVTTADFPLKKGFLLK